MFSALARLMPGGRSLELTGSKISGCQSVGYNTEYR
jgi:hypothetical protein